MEIDPARSEAKCKTNFSATAIHTRTFRIPSDLRRQAGNGSVSTMVGDHMGILSAVVFFFELFHQYFHDVTLPQ